MRIIIPGVPDKKIPYALTMKNAEELSKYGVKVYRYLPGFLHAKGALVDDRICSLGSVNLDYRSLYLHFEVNTILEDEKIIKSLKNDFLKTQEQSALVLCQKHTILKRIALAVLNVFAPFL